MDRLSIIVGMVIFSNINFNVCNANDFFLSSAIECIKMGDEDGAVANIEQCKPVHMMTAKIENQNIILYCIEKGMGDDVISIALEKLQQCSEGFFKVNLELQIKDALIENGYVTFNPGDEEDAASEGGTLQHL